MSESSPNAAPDKNSGKNQSNKNPAKKKNAAAKKKLNSPHPSKGKKFFFEKWPFLTFDIGGILFLWACMADCHSLLGLVFYFVALAIGYLPVCSLVRKKSKSRTWAVIAFVALLFATAVVAVNNQPSKPISFSVRCGIDNVGVNTWVVTGTNFQATQFPVRREIEIQFQNRSSETIMIDTFWLEYLTDDGWKRFQPMWVFDPYYVVVGFPTDGAFRFAKYSPGIFINTIQNKNILPNETIQGWIFFETNVAIPATQMRFHMLKSNGDVAETEIQGEPYHWSSQEIGLQLSGQFDSRVATNIGMKIDYGQRPH